MEAAIAGPVRGKSRASTEDKNTKDVRGRWAIGGRDRAALKEITDGRLPPGGVKP